MGPQSFTYHYAQPPEYRFCQDSVLFPAWIAERLWSKDIPTGFRALDVCAGCGVIGFELAFHEPRLTQIDFLEVQEEFRAPFEVNAEQSGQPGFRFINENYRALERSQYANAYDLIIGNPPYFYPGEGRRPPSEMRERCRFFVDADLRELITGVTNALKPGSDAYLLVKNGVLHGRNAMRSIALWLAGAAQAELAGEVRGTMILHVMKNKKNT